MTTYGFIDDLDPTERDEALFEKGYVDQSGEEYDYLVGDDEDLWDSPEDIDQWEDYG